MRWSSPMPSAKQNTVVVIHVRLRGEANLAKVVHVLCNFSRAPAHGCKTGAEGEENGRSLFDDEQFDECETRKGLLVINLFI